MESLDPGDSHAALADYLRQVIRAALALPAEDRRLREQVEICNQLIRILQTSAGDEIADKAVAESGRRLLSLRKAAPGRGAWERPDTPLSLGCLLTGTRLDPSLVSQLRKEIQSAGRVDILCSFIKWSGIRILEEALRAFTRQQGAQLRVITTSLRWVIRFYSRREPRCPRVSISSLLAVGANRRQ